MFKQIAEFYGLYLERKIGTPFHVLGNYAGKEIEINAFGMDIAGFRATCEAF